MLKQTNAKFSRNPESAYELLSKAIELVHDEKELRVNRLVRERLVATIAIERGVKPNMALGRILQRIHSDARSGAQNRNS